MSYVQLVRDLENEKPRFVIILQHDLNCRQFSIRQYGSFIFSEQSLNIEDPDFLGKWNYSVYIFHKP